MNLYLFRSIVNDLAWPEVEPQPVEKELNEIVDPLPEKLKNTVVSYKYWIDIFIPIP